MLTQMFGLPHIQGGPLDPDADYVVLFQRGDGFGLPLRLSGYTIQFLLTKEDSAALRFDKVITAVAC